MSANYTVTPPLNLDDYRWQNRLLLVFVPTAQDAACRQQHSFLGQSRDLLDRDLLVASIYEQGEGQIDGQLISASDSQALRTQFGITPDTFTAILIGKDGGEKRRFDAPVHPNELFAIIDAMPMRQQEMKDET